MTPEEVTGLFRLDEKAVSLDHVTTGHINDTYKVFTSQQEEPSYILQRLNSNVFNDIPAILENIRVVDEFLNSEASVGFRCPSLIQALSGEYFVQDDDGMYWRCFEYIKGTKTYDIPPRPSYASEAGKMIGAFHSALQNLPHKLTVTIPHFHDFDFRWHQFTGSLKSNFGNRAEDAKDLILFALIQRKSMQEYFHSFRKRGVLERPVHYDTKFNNILFSDDGEAISLIDLDTLMPGYIQFDYGDALRTLACTSEEDEEEISEVKFDIPLFEGFSRSYFSKVKWFLHREEISLFVKAPQYITFIIGLRFLTDYLNGDIYFRVSKDRHNLIRARNQFRMVELFIEQQPRIEKIVSKSK